MSGTLEKTHLISNWRTAKKEKRAELSEEEIKEMGFHDLLNFIEEEADDMVKAEKSRKKAESEKATGDTADNEDIFVGNTGARNLNPQKPILPGEDRNWDRMHSFSTTELEKLKRILKRIGRVEEAFLMSKNIDKDFKKECLIDIEDIIKWCKKNNIDEKFTTELLRRYAQIKES